MFYRSLVVLAGFVGMGIAFGLDTLPSVVEYDSSEVVSPGTIIGADWYNQVSSALKCSDGSIFVGFDSTGGILCSSDSSVVGDVQSGEGSGGVALTVNDGYGNANVAFNHQDGTPEQDGNSARIEVNTDSTTGVFMDFEL